MPPMSKAQERQRRISLVAMYILGVGIGCVLVGLLLHAKRAMLAGGSNPPPTQTAPALPGGGATNAPTPAPGDGK